MRYRKKGMSLMEIVIAMAIAGVLALLLVEIMNSVNAMMRATTDLNRRMAYEGQFADNLEISNATPNDEISVQIDYGGGSVISLDNFSENKVVEYTVGYDDSIHVSPVSDDALKAEANYRFFIVQPFRYEPVDAPETPFMLTIDFEALGDGKYDVLDKLTITGTTSDADYALNPSGTGLVGTPKGTGTVSSFDIEPSLLQAGWVGKTATATGHFTLSIPIPYVSGVELNPDLGKGDITVTVKVDHLTPHAAEIQNKEGIDATKYDWLIAKCAYHTATRVELPDGSMGAQYFTNAEYQVKNVEEERNIDGVTTTVKHSECTVIG
jgi:prepilin-type N-terminal cleavage/methylation domain-containing protein